MEVILSKEYVYSLLEDKKMQKATFAQLIGISRTNLDALLDSKKKDINVVIKMAEALGMSLQEFISFAPSEFKIKGLIKVGEELREIKKEEDWYKAEADSGVCSVPYYSSYDAACSEIGNYLKNVLRDEKESSFMGRVNGEAVFCITSVCDNETEACEKTIVVSVLSKAKGMTTHSFSTLENKGDFGYMIEEIKAEIMDLFYNKNE